jgi:hypothetical protein
MNEMLMWLCHFSNNQWLLIFDNVNREFETSSENAKVFDVKAYFSKTNYDFILVTSRLASLWRLESNMKLKQMNDVQKKSILTNSFEKSAEDKRTSNADFFRRDLISESQQIRQNWFSYCKIFHWRSIESTHICEKQTQMWRSTLDYTIRHDENWWRHEKKQIAAFWRHEHYHLIIFERRARRQRTCYCCERFLTIKIFDMIFLHLRWIKKLSTKCLIDLLNVQTMNLTSRNAWNFFWNISSLTSKRSHHRFRHISFFIIDAFMHLKQTALLWADLRW